MASQSENDTARTQAQMKERRQMHVHIHLCMHGQIVNPKSMRPSNK